MLVQYNMLMALNAIVVQGTKQSIGLGNQKRLHGENGISSTV